MSHNTWAHRVARRSVVRPLTKVNAAPNQVTTARLLFGLAAAASLAIGTYTWSVVGAALFVISFILDRADGDLARLTGQTSQAGHTYDLVSDTVCNSLTFVGLGIGLVASPLGPWALLLGLLAAGSVAGILFLVVRIEKLQGARAAELKGIGGFDPDDAMLIVPVAIVIDASHELLVAASVCTPLFMLLFLIAFRRDLMISRSG